eukprot:gene15682-11223_t
MQALVPDTLWEIGGLAATLYSIGQARQHHVEQLSQSRKHHEVEIDLAVKQHKKNLVETKRVYLLELFTNLEQHFQQLNADLISSSKEAERDMFDQRNQNFQTIILASSVMFTALSTVIIDGGLPSRTTEGLIVAFALTSALSFAFLFLSMVICMELVMRASSFMYRRARNHTEQLRQAIKDTKLMMEELRNGTRNKDEFRHGNGSVREDHPVDNNGCDKPGDLSPAVSDPLSTATGEGLAQRGLNSKTPTMSSMASSSVPPHKPRKHRALAELDEEGLDREWRNHETELQKFLAERERINDATALLGVDEKYYQNQAPGDDTVSVDRERAVNRKSFQEFWNESCKFWAELSILFFYGGTVNLLLAIMIFMWSQFLHAYHSLIGAVIAISLISFTLVLGLCSVIGLRQMKMMEILYHPEEATRRRIGQSRPTFRQYNSQASWGGLGSRSSSQLPSRVDAAGHSLYRGQSISYLPEFGTAAPYDDDGGGGGEGDDEGDEQSRSVSSSGRSVPLTMTGGEDSERGAMSPPVGLPSPPPMSRNSSGRGGGILLTKSPSIRRYPSPSQTIRREVSFKHTVDTAGPGDDAADGPASPYHHTTVPPSTPVTHATAASSRGDNVPSLFRRPSPRTLFPSDTPMTAASTTTSDDRLTRPPRPPPAMMSPTVVATAVPATPSTTDTSSSRTQPSYSQRSQIPQLDRRTLLGRQSSAPSALYGSPSSSYQGP